MTAGKLIYYLTVTEHIFHISLLLWAEIHSGVVSFVLKNLYKYL